MRHLFVFHLILKAFGTYFKVPLTQSDENSRILTVSHDSNHSTTTLLFDINLFGLDNINIEDHSSTSAKNTGEILLLGPGSPGRLVLYRIQATLEVHQLEDQHVSRFGKRMEGIFIDFFSCLTRFAVLSFLCECIPNVSTTFNEVHFPTLQGGS